MNPTPFSPAFSRRSFLQQSAKLGAISLTGNLTAEAQPPSTAVKPALPDFCLFTKHLIGLSHRELASAIDENGVGEAAGWTVVGRHGRSQYALQPVPLPGDLVKRSYSEPHWEKNQGAVVAYERVTLFGVTLVAHRRMQYSMVKIATATASKITNSTLSR